MADIVSVFAVIALIIFLGFFGEQIFKKTNVPDVLLLMIIGIIIGTYLNWVDASNFGFASTLFTTFALVFLLFQGALNIDFRTLVRSLSSTLELTVLTFAATVFVVTLISVLLGFDFIIALLIGIILGGTSSAVVIPLVSKVDLDENQKYILTLESAISDVLSILGTITVLEIMKTGLVQPTGIFNSILSSFSLALVVGVIVGFVWVILMSKYMILVKSYLLTIAVVMGLYAFVESSFVGASGAIAAFAFALVLGNSRSILKILKPKNKNSQTNHHLVKNVLLPSTKNFYSEISFFVKTFFFVYLGILIDFSNLYVFVYGLILTVGIFLVRPFIVKLVFINSKVTDKQRTLMEILIPKGLAAAVLAGLAVQSGFLPEGVVASFVNMILSVVFLSILFTSVLIFFAQKEMFKGLIPFFYNSQKKEAQQTSDKK